MDAQQIESIHSSMTIAMVVSGACSFVALMVGPLAPYGRYSKGGWWGPLIPANIAWLTQELPSFIVPLSMLLCSGPASLLSNPLSARTILAATFLMHYTYRTFVFPLRIRGGKPTPLGVFVLTVSFCLWNGFLQGWMLSTQLPMDAPFSLISTVGILIWMFGWLNVMYADNILISLRKPGETGYKIPYGGMFQLVSAGNYTSEIIEWSGWALAAGRPCAIAFAFFTFCNLAPRGLSHHQWYQQKFKGEYPAGRKAVIPFLW